MGSRCGIEDYIQKNIMADNKIDMNVANSSDKNEIGIGDVFVLLRKPPKLIDAKSISNEQLHQHCMFALQQNVEHGNTGLGIQLLEKLENRHQVKRKIARWFCKFGKFKINRSGRLEYRKRKNVTKENIDVCLKMANDIPFYSERLGPVNIARLCTTPFPKARKKFGREYGGESSSSVWTISGGLPSLGKHH